MLFVNVYIYIYTYILTGIISIFTPRFAHVRGNNIIPNNAQRNMKNAMIINTGINFLIDVTIAKNKKAAFKLLLNGGGGEI